MAAPATPPGASAPSADGLRQRLTPAQAQRQRDRDREERAVADAVAGPPSAAVRQMVEHAAPALAVLAAVINKVGPFYAKAAEIGYGLYRTLPLDVLHALVGAALCFFGGAYVASIAAVEAFALVGWSTTGAALEEIYEDLRLIKAAHDEDERKKTDGDGAAITLLKAAQEQPAELLQSKLRVAAMAVRDPEKLTTAVAGVYAGWIAVQGTLRLEFAKTITLGVSIASMLDAPALRYGLPLLAHVVPPEYQRWLPTLIRTAAKAIAISLAWYLSVVIAAIQSALRGGQLCAKGLLRWAAKHELVAGVGAEEGGFADEALGYALASLGFYTQWAWGFALPFPFNIVMAPFSLVEWWIRWSMTG